MLRAPFIEIKGPDGIDLVTRLRDEFVSIRITDVAEGETDEAHIVLRRDRPYRQPPAAGTEYSVRLGWEAGSAVVTGTYTFQRLLYSGDPDRGEEMTLVCRAADVTDAMKTVDSEHFDAENGHRTYGDVFRTLARRGSLGVAIDPAIADLPLPGGYLLRWKQSPIGLASDLADDLGAIVKPQAGKLTVRRRGSLAAPSGARLPTVRMQRVPGYFFQVDLEPRFAFSQVNTDFFDGHKGRPAGSMQQLQRGASRYDAPHPVGSEKLAEAMSKASAQRLEAEAATALFSGPGTALAVAGAPLAAEGYGPDVDALQWEIVSAVHDASPVSGGWITTTEVREAGSRP